MFYLIKDWKIKWSSSSYINEEWYITLLYNFTPEEEELLMRDPILTLIEDWIQTYSVKEKVEKIWIKIIKDENGEDIETEYTYEEIEDIEKEITKYIVNIENKLELQIEIEHDNIYENLNKIYEKDLKEVKNWYSSLEIMWWFRQCQEAEKVIADNNYNSVLLENLRKSSETQLELANLIIWKRDFFDTVYWNAWWKKRQALEDLWI